MRIRTRLTLYFTLLVMTLFTLMAAITYYSIKAYTEKAFYNRLEAKAHTSADLLMRVARADSSLLRIIDSAQYDLLSEENIEIYDLNNHYIYTNNDTVDFFPADALLNQIRVQGEMRFTQKEFRIVGLYDTLFPQKMVVLAGAVDAKGAALLNQLKWTLIVSLLFSLLLVAAVGWFFVGGALDPISSIIRQVKTLSPLERSERLPKLSENDEISALINTFNGLFDNMEDLFRLQKDFAANVSHELNNPLTKIKSQIEVSLMQLRDSESYRKTLVSIHEDVNELVDLIRDLLSFSKYSSEQFVAPAIVRVDELLFDVRDHVINHFPDYNVSIKFVNPPQSEEAFSINGNKPLITTAIKNIVENACKFAADKSAELSLITEGEVVSLTISDNGPGIPAKDLPHVFELFYRSPSLETVKGYGIGLALAQRILKAHGFGLKVNSIPDVGTTFIVRFSN